MLPKNSLVCLKEENPGAPSTPQVLSPPPHSPSFNTVTQVRIKATGKEKPLTSLTPASGANINTCSVSPELANSISSQSLTKRALIRMQPDKLRYSEASAEFRNNKHRKDFCLGNHPHFAWSQ